MSAEIVSNSGGIVTARITGVLTQPDLARLQQSVVSLLRQQGSLRILVIAEDFRGWQEGDEWGEVSFMENDPYIRKMAIVGERQWENLVLVFTAKVLRPFPIEYFQPSDLARAQAWLAE
jgi:hypothetical protein